jgi:hypothetical protein
MVGRQQTLEGRRGSENPEAVIQVLLGVPLPEVVAERADAPRGGSSSPGPRYPGVEPTTMAAKLAPKAREPLAFQGFRPKLSQSQEPSVSPSIVCGAQRSRNAVLVAELDLVSPRDTSSRTRTLRTASVPRDSTFLRSSKSYISSNRGESSSAQCSTRRPTAATKRCSCGAGSGVVANGLRAARASA